MDYTGIAVGILAFVAGRLVTSKPTIRITVDGEGVEVESTNMSADDVLKLTTDAWEMWETLKPPVTSRDNS